MRRMKPSILLDFPERFETERLSIRGPLPGDRLERHPPHVLPAVEDLGVLDVVAEQDLGLDAEQVLRVAQVRP